MATTYLSEQHVPNATATSFYTVSGTTGPVTRNATISSITVTNTSATASTFSITHRVANDTLADKQYLYKDVPIAGGDTFIGTFGGTANSTDQFYGSDANATCAMCIYGVEKDAT